MGCTICWRYRFFHAVHGWIPKHNCFYDALKEES